MTALIFERKGLSKTEVLERLNEYASKYSSQRELANYLGVSPAYVSKVLTGKSSPNKKILRLIGIKRRCIVEFTEQ